MSSAHNDQKQQRTTMLVCFHLHSPNTTHLPSFYVSKVYLSCSIVQFHLQRWEKKRNRGKGTRETKLKFFLKLHSHSTVSTSAISMHVSPSPLDRYDKDTQLIQGLPRHENVHKSWLMKGEATNTLSPQVSTYHK